jgi:hypothetical protein
MILLKGFSLLKSSEIGFDENGTQTRLRIVFGNNEYRVHRETFNTLSYVMTEDFLYEGQSIVTANYVFDRYS